MMHIFRKLSLGLFVVLVILINTSELIYSQAITPVVPSPASHFGFTPGDDRMLFTYEEMIEYFRKLESVSPRIKIEQIGHSELGKPMYLLFVSSEGNIANLDRLKSINRKLALDFDILHKERTELVREGKVFFLMTLSMHSNEVGPSQAAPLIVHELITSDDPKIADILENTVYMITPSHNPDGMNMIVENYKKYKGTRYEGSSMPGVYHKYVGHNINRDFVTLAMSENDAISRVYSKEWFPQVMVERHQMGSRGPRYYISPPSDPLSENILPGLWNWKRIFGSRALTSMTDEGLKGVSVNYLFDMYWPGHTGTSLWKGVIAMLSEAASVDIASPIYIEPNELSVTGKGLAEYEISINMPDPWPGGWWHLSDIVEYERVNTISYLHTASVHKEEILTFRNEITKKEVERGKNEAPYYYILPAQQHDQSELASLINLLDKHGIDSYRLINDRLINNRLHRKGDVVIPLSQPYRSFIKEVMEAQKFPVRHFSANGEMIRPYDITSWSLPLHKGVEAIEINTKIDLPYDELQIIEIPFKISDQGKETFTGVLFSASNNESYKAAFLASANGLKVERLTEVQVVDGNEFPAGSFYIPSQRNLDNILRELMVQPLYLAENFAGKTMPVNIPRIALVESWFHDMDAGWTRYLFDTHQIPYKVLRPSDLQEVNLSRNFDMVIFPDQGKSILMEGKGGSPGNYTISRYPPEYAKGMGQKGLSNLLDFVDKGGKVVSWGRSTDIFMGNLSIDNDKEGKQEFNLPVRNIGEDLGKKGLDVTGSLLRVRLRPDHPLTYGMPEETGVFHRGNPVFATSFPYFDMDRRVIASFTKDSILMRGFIENEKLLSDQAAMVWVKKGKGQLVLFSFCPQFRGSTPATYKLLFNSILLN
jgi:hypothetical protein